ncbi:Tyrosine recombinase XerC [Brevundimonas sp. NIBR11]|nr:Tyrosine recombinase XerC [Brevundimonas sp. NIBR11]
MMSDARDKSGKGQANRVKAVLSKMFNIAIRDGVMSVNPCKGVDGYRIERRWDHMSEVQVTALLSACDRFSDQNAANVVRLLLFTGARLREVLKAEWSQFDLQRGFWIKPSAHTKQRQTHRLALPPEAVEIVRTMQDDPLSDRWLFPGKDPEKHRGDFKRPWAAILELAEIGHWRRHDLRRTTATFMLSGGEDITVVGKTLGHTQMQTTLSYASLMPENQRAGLSRAVKTMTALRVSVS